MRQLWVVIGAAVIAAIVMLYGIYRRVRRATIQKLRAGSRIADTSRGPLEYAVEGAGPAILAIHGSGGGYEFGRLLTRLIDPGKFTIVGISRPGFRQTPLSTGPTPEQQADAAAGLLDQLNIKEAAILGLSAGGLTAMQLALRHPGRCRALILVSAAMPPMPSDRVSPSVLAGLRFLVSVPDFPLLVLIAPYRLWPVFIDASRIGGPALVTDPAAAAIGWEIRFFFGPHSDVRAGILNDVQQITALDRYPLEEIKVPTLIIHGSHDLAVPVGLAEHAARTIPRAQSLIIEGGSHLVIATHYREVGQRIQQFLGEG